MTLLMRRSTGLMASAAVVAGIIAACRPGGDIGYVQINTVPTAPVTAAALYLDATRLAPIRQGSALLRQPVGTLKLEADAFGGARAAICDIVVKRNRITTVTVSVLERPPRCLCRFSGNADANGHTCVS
jgi:hypothetical protein